MSFMIKRGALIAAAGALALAMPVAAAQAAPPSSHGNHGHHGVGHGNGHGNKAAGKSSHSHKCMPHNSAYVEAGMVDAATTSTLAMNTDGTWSGTLVVDVKTANHMAKADKGQTVTYTFTDAKLRVRFDGGTTGFAAGERVKLIGKEAAVAKKCTALSPAPSPVFRMIVVQPAAA